MKVKAFVLAAGALGSGVVAYRRVIRPWWWTWGVDGRDVGRELPGDDLVPRASTADTRSIEIEAPLSDVWPWLLQMGYGRAGWYSYDAIDMSGSSSRRLRPEWSTLDVGDIVPTHPGGGFEVRILDPEHALVLYSDTALVASQQAAARADGLEQAAANVQATGAVLGAAQPSDFAASWAFILEPTTGHRTRLIERFRVSFGKTDKPWTAATLPLIGFGVFLMTRKQMLGIRDRAEALARSRPAGWESDSNGSRTTPLVATQRVAPVAVA
jgi:hypothetical protein